MTLVAAISMCFFASFPIQDPAQMTGPPPEMKKLDAFVGEWTGTFKFTMEGMPATEGPSTVKEEKVLGGMYHRTVYSVVLPGLPALEGHSMLGYDTGEKKYKSWTFDNQAYSPREESGTFDGAKLVMISKPQGGFVSRVTYTPNGANEMHFLLEFQAGDKWTKAGECNFKRKVSTGLR